MSPLASSASILAATESSGSGLWTILIAVVIAGGVIWGVVHEHQRKKKLQAFAASRQLTYTARDDRWVRIDTGHPYGQGRSHKAKHVMTGQHRGRPIVIFEHEWTTGSGKNSQTHQVRKTLMGLPNQFPKLELRPEGFFGRAARRMGMKDIELESDAFNQAYRVAGHRRFAYDILHPRFMQWMLHTGAPGFTINGPYISLYGDGNIDTAKLDQEVAYLDAIVDQLPGYVVGR